MLADSIITVTESHQFFLSAPEPQGNPVTLDVKGSDTLLAAFDQAAAKV